MQGVYEVWACSRHRLGTSYEQWFLSKTFTTRLKANLYCGSLSNCGYASRVKYVRGRVTA